VQVDGRGNTEKKKEEEKDSRVKLDAPPEVL
jgi:hypothetical protein